MKNYPLLILLFTCSLSLNGIANDFSDYYKMVNEAEEEFAMYHNTGKCFSLYDHAFKEYDKPYIRDCYIAAQIAYYSGDTVRFMNYIGLAFKNGMPLSAYCALVLLRNTIANQAIYSWVQKAWEQNYLSFKLDSIKADSLYLMSYTNDSLASHKAIDTTKMRKKVARESQMREYIDNQYISKGIFPSEKYIGVHSDSRYQNFLKKYNKTDLYDQQAMMKAFANNKMGMKLDSSGIDKSEYELWNNFGYNIFIHSTCSWQNYKDKLWKCVLTGYLPPRNYGLLEETSIMWNRTNTFHKMQKICDYPIKKAYFNILGYDRLHPNETQTFRDDPENLKLVEANRAGIFMQKYSVDLEKRKLEKEKGFRFFFGWM